MTAHSEIQSNLVGFLEKYCVDIYEYLIVNSLFIWFFVVYSINNYPLYAGLVQGAFTHIS